MTKDARCTKANSLSSESQQNPQHSSEGQLHQEKMSGWSGLFSDKIWKSLGLMVRKLCNAQEASSRKRPVVPGFSAAQEAVEQPRAAVMSGADTAAARFISVTQGERRAPSSAEKLRATFSGGILRGFTDSVEEPGDLERRIMQSTRQQRPQAFIAAVLVRPHL